MSFKITGPVIQHLGFQGEYYLLKVVFPIHEVTDQDLHHLVEHEIRPAGRKAIILKFRAEDLPDHSNTGEILHFNIGKIIQEYFQNK